MELGGDSQTAGGQRSPFYLCSHLADCFFSSATLDLSLCLYPPSPLLSADSITLV